MEKIITIALFHQKLSFRHKEKMQAIWYKGEKKF